MTKAELIDYLTMRYKEFEQGMCDTRDRDDDLCRYNILRGQEVSRILALVNDLDDPADKEPCEVIMRRDVINELHERYYCGHCNEMIGFGTPGIKPELNNYCSNCGRRLGGA
jgi:ribosomal protein S27AE